MPTPPATCGNRTTFEIRLDDACALKLRGIWQTHGELGSGLFALVRFGKEPEGDAFLRGMIFDGPPRKILGDALAQVRATTAHHDLGEL